ncbi:MAG: DUF4249 family protein [Reichenbachiella sp.]|uniref:DUF4249 family protein n=1 Tax=Reichenbachiella sp. TaxID=2184521 RepID=UPI003267DDF0
MMNRGGVIFSILVLLGLVLINACVENFKFETKSEASVLVIESFISDQSYNDLLTQPLDPRYFQVKLSSTSRVTNILDQAVTDAEVSLIDESNEHWDYSEDEDGIYRLYFETFRAETDKQYKLRIVLSDGKVYESTYEGLPADVSSGGIVLEEKTIRDYRVVSGESRIVDVDGLAIKLKTARNNTDQELIYNRWDFETTYGFVARLLPTQTDPNYKCWVTEELYYNDFVIAKETLGDAEHEMFFFDSKDENLHEGFSVLIRHQMMNELNYQFWEDLDNQKKQADVFAPPPYNLISNLSAVDHDGEVYGYFGVVREKYYRWTFSPDMLSYPVVYPEDLKNSCNIPRPPFSCYDCRYVNLVSRSRVTNNKPIWWDK